MLDRLFNRNRPEPTSQPDLMTIRQAAALLSCSREWVRKLIKRKELRAENRHGRWVVFTEDVIALQNGRPFAEQQRRRDKRLWAKAQNQKLWDKRREEMAGISSQTEFDEDGEKWKVSLNQDGKVLGRMKI